MQLVRGMWLPDGDSHFVEQMGFSPSFAGAGTYQFQKFATAFPFIRDFRHAVDVGAHCGLWARVLARCFAKVTAFEPVSLHRELLAINAPGVTVHPCALGDQTGAIGMQPGEKSSGDAHVNTFKSDIPLRTLDSFELPGVDFLKIDVEGFELFVIRGGERTIKSCKPVIIIEQKKDCAERYGQSRFAATELLESWGAKKVYSMAGDICLNWK